MYMKYLSHSWIMGAFLCYSVHYVQQFTRICSVMTLTTISIERYLAIAYPMKTLWLNSIGRCKKVIFLIWCVAAILAIPAGLRLDYEVLETARGRTAYWCLRGFPDRIVLAAPKIELTHGLCQFLLMLVIPLVTMSYCYVGIAKIVFSSSKNEALMAGRLSVHRSSAASTAYSPLSPQVGSTQKRRNTRKTSARVCDQSRKQIVRMLLAIVVLYSICWGPTLVDDLLVGFEVICLTTYMSQSPNLLKQMRMIFAVMAYANSCVNPLVYGFMSRHFRNTFKATCCRCQEERQRERECLKSRTSAMGLSNADISTNVRATLHPDGKNVLATTDERSASWQNVSTTGSFYQSTDHKTSAVEVVCVCV